MVSLRAIFLLSKVQGKAIPIQHIFLFCVLTLFELAGGANSGGTSILGSRGVLAPKFASEICVRAPNFASKKIYDKYPKFCPLNFRYDPKICVADLCEFSWVMYSLV